MIKKIIIAGFGGQGIILAGKLLAYAAMIEGLEVSLFPSYGAEMRGGTCNCSVIISDKKISSPIISVPDITLVLNKPSKNKFEPKIKENGVMILNSSIIEDKVSRKDVSEHYIDATNIAEKTGSIRSANMVMLGALAKATKVVQLNTLIKSLPEVVSARNKSLIDINANALKKGYDFIK